MPVVCRFDNCGLEIMISDIEKFCGKEKAEKYKKSIIERYISDDPNLIKCSTPNCPSILRIDPSNPDKPIHCHLCENEFNLKRIINAQYPSSYKQVKEFLEESDKYKKLFVDQKKWDEKEAEEENLLYRLAHIQEVSYEFRRKIEEMKRKNEELDDKEKAEIEDLKNKRKEGNDNEDLNYQIRKKENDHDLMHKQRQRNLELIDKEQNNYLENLKIVKNNYFQNHHYNIKYGDDIIRNNNNNARNNNNNARNNNNNVRNDNNNARNNNNNARNNNNNARINNNNARNNNNNARSDNNSYRFFGLISNILYSFIRGSNNGDNRDANEDGRPENINATNEGGVNENIENVHDDNNNNNNDANDRDENKAFTLPPMNCLKKNKYLRWKKCIDG